MKENILITLLFILLIKIASEEKIYKLKKYKSYTYNDTETSYSVLESINVEGKEIDITYEIENGNFSNTSLYYYFTDTNAYDKKIIENEFKVVNSKKNESSKSKNKFKACYRIIKSKQKKYLVLRNLPNKEGKTIEVKNRRTSKKTVIIIFVISLIVICGIIAAFVFIGKYIYKKRQKEVMTNYASSFVAENPGLMPNDESNAIIENDEKRDSHIKIDD